MNEDKTKHVIEFAKVFYTLYRDQPFYYYADLRDSLADICDALGDDVAIIGKDVQRIFKNAILAADKLEERMFAAMRPNYPLRDFRANENQLVKSLCREYDTSQSTVEYIYSQYVDFNTKKEITVHNIPFEEVSRKELIDHISSAIRTSYIFYREDDMYVFYSNINGDNFGSLCFYGGFDTELAQKLPEYMNGKVFVTMYALDDHTRSIAQLWSSMK